MIRNSRFRRTFFLALLPNFNLAQDLRLRPLQQKHWRLLLFLFFLELERPDCAGVVSVLINSSDVVATVSSLVVVLVFLFLHAGGASSAIPMVSVSGELFRRYPFGRDFFLGLGTCSGRPLQEHQHQRQYQHRRFRPHYYYHYSFSWTAGTFPCPTSPASSCSCGCCCCGPIPLCWIHQLYIIQAQISTIKPVCSTQFGYIYTEKDGDLRLCLDLCQHTEST